MAEALTRDFLFAKQDVGIALFLAAGFQQRNHYVCMARWSAVRVAQLTTGTSSCIQRHSLESDDITFQQRE